MAIPEVYPPPLGTVTSMIMTFLVRNPDLSHYFLLWGRPKLFLWDDNSTVNIASNISYHLTTSIHIIFRGISLTWGGKAGYIKSILPIFPISTQTSKWEPTIINIIIPKNEKIERKKPQILITFRSSGI